MTIRELAEKCDLECVTQGDSTREVRGCYIGDLLSWVMGRAKSGQAWITIMTNLNVVAVAVLADVACVIIPEGCEIGEDVLAKAREKGVALLRSAESAYETALRIAPFI